jgi:hypothetical protein
MKATIDRIEGNIAVLIAAEDQTLVFNLPISFIGAAQEGDIVDITITKDPGSTQVAKERVSSLIEKLKNKPN